MPRLAVISSSPTYNNPKNKKYKPLVLDSAESSSFDYEHINHNNTSSTKTSPVLSSPFFGKKAALATMTTKSFSSSSENDHDAPINRNDGSLFLLSTMDSNEQHQDLDQNDDDPMLRIRMMEKEPRDSADSDYDEPEGISHFYSPPLLDPIASADSEESWDEEFARETSLFDSHSASNHDGDDERDDDDDVSDVDMNSFVQEAGGLREPPLQYPQSQFCTDSLSEKGGGSLKSLLSGMFSCNGAGQTT
mmetsp:Transcript_26627/g.40275  ORF Transcript_26627/g.40275 Transcript_26627/m.40275 type:complete len:248 (-) Transcript_26627:9-752(-)